MEPVRHVLPSGLEILVAPHAGAHVAAVQVYVWAGSLHEEANERGGAHFIEHMLFKGTKKRKVGEIGALVENAGGDINAYTTFDRTVYYLTLPSAQTELGIDILADAVFASTFDPEELEREREVILEEIRRGNDDPGSIVGKRIFSLMYPGTEAGRPIIGSVESVSGMSRDDLLGFYKRHYEPTRASVVVAGDVEPEKIIPLVAKYFEESWSKDQPAKIASKPVPDFKHVKGGGVAIIKGEYEQTRMELAFPGPAMTDLDGLYVDLAAYVLGGSEISRLQSRLRDRDGIVSAVGCSAYSPSFRGVVEVSAAVDPEELLNVSEAIGREIALFLTSEPATSLDIDRARAAFRINRIHREETVDGVARGLGLSLMTPLKEKFESTYERLLDDVTAEDVMAGFARWFSVDQLALVALGNNSLELKESELKESFLKGWNDVQKKFAGAKNKSSHNLHKERITTTRWNLPNGVPVIYRHLPKARMFSLIAATEGGLRSENTDQAGIFHAAAGMCGLSTEKRSYEEFAGRLEDIGSVVAGFSGKDSCGWEVHTINDYAEETLAMFGESLLQMKIPETQWASQQRETLHTMKMQKDSASYRCMRKLSEEVYKDHPYAAPVLGWPETIESFSAADLESHYRKWRDGGRWVIGVAGGLPEDELKRILTKELATWRPQMSGKRSHTGQLKPRKVQDVTSNKMDKEQAHVAIGWRGLGWSDPDRAALDVAINILGGHGGRLFVTLRDQQSLAYSVSPLASQGCEGGLVGAYLACKPDKVQQALQGLHLELSKISSELVSDQELERSKNHILGSHEISLQRSSSQAMTMALMELYGVGWDDFERYPDAVRNVTKQDVLRIAKRLFGETKPVEVVVGPDAL